MVPGGPRKSVVSCGNGRCVVGWTLLGAERLLDGWVLLGFGGGGAGGALVCTVVGAIAGGAAEGALATGGGIGAALGGGDGGAVGVVTGRVGMTAPVGPNGSRDTIVMAETTTPTAMTPSTPTVTGPNQVVQDQRLRGTTLTGGASPSPRSPRGHSISRSDTSCATSLLR